MGCKSLLGLRDFLDAESPSDGAHDRLTRNAISVIKNGISCRLDFFMVVVIRLGVLTSCPDYGKKVPKVNSLGFIVYFFKIK